MEGQARFEGTRWSVVSAARQGGSPAAEKALSELCRTYWFPLYAYVRHRGCSHHEAEDITQGFFCHLLSKDGLASVDREKGKFRSFLLSSVRHYLSNVRVREAAAKRGGGHETLSIDMTDADGRAKWEPVDPDSHERLYDRDWAVAVLSGVMRSLEDDYQARDRAEVFKALRPFVGDADRHASYASAATQLGTTEGNVKVQVHRLRRRFGEHLREQVRHTVSTEAEIDGELRHLMACFSE